MTQFVANAHDGETSSQDADVRRVELNGQAWNRTKSENLAKSEGFSLSDEHWDVIVFLRGYYLEFGLPRSARITARTLNVRFAELGGNKYLHRLFAGGPIAQGSRLAGLRAPAYATDVSFGTSF